LFPRYEGKRNALPAITEYDLMDGESIPSMPEGEEYDEETERERLEAWRQYYANMQMYSGSPMVPPVAPIGYMNPNPMGGGFPGRGALWDNPMAIHQANTPGYVTLESEVNG
jgi:hypothetical protein